MKIINLERGKGKSIRLLYASEFNDMPILCSTMVDKRYLKEQADKYGLKIPEPITVNDVASGFFKDIDVVNNGILIDEAHSVLQNLLSSLGMRGGIRAITLTSDELKEYNYTGHQSVSTNEYKTVGRNLDLRKLLNVKSLTYIKQNPYVGEDGIYVPLEEYVEEGCASTYRCVLTKEMFVEAYNKWIKSE